MLLPFERNTLNSFTSGVMKGGYSACGFMFDIGSFSIPNCIADVTSEITNELIEGGLGLFQTHGTVPAEVYNTLNKKKKKKKRKIHL